MKNILRSSKGITLVALIVTIIILLILAGVTISTLGGNGLFEKTKQAAEETKYANAEEKVKLAVMASYGINGALEDELLKENVNKIDGLESKVENIEYDLTIKVDGYEFKITQSGTVNGVDRTENESSGDSNTGNFEESAIIGTVTTSVQEINGEYLKIKVDVDDATDVRGYGIIVNNELNQVFLENNEAVVKNLECDTKYDIIGYALDKNNCIKKSEKQEITTLDKQYLYKSGEEFIALTGGWKRGAYNVGTFTKEADYMNLNQTAVTEGTQYWNCCETVDSVNVADYSKICFKYKNDYSRFVSSSNLYYYWTRMGICNPKFASYSSQNFVKIAYGAPWSSEDDLKAQILTAEADITSIEQNVYPTISFIRHSDANFTQNTNVYEVWLER